MLSSGDQIGFEATITRPDGTKFNEYDVKTTVNDKGEATTECWLESENDAVYEIKLKRTRHHLKQFKDSGWRARRYVDGRKLRGSVWRTPLEPTSLRYIYIMEAGPPQVWREGLLSFAPAGTTNRDDLVTIDPNCLASLGSIKITLEPGEWTRSTRHPPRDLAALGLAHETGAKLAMATKAAKEVILDRPPEHQTYCLETHRPGPWQTFVFKYRHRSVLENMGVIEAPPVPPPAAAIRKRKARASLADAESVILHRPGSRLADPIEVSDSEDDKGLVESEVARQKRIKLLEEELEKLKNGGVGKGKGKETIVLKVERDEAVD